MKPSKKQLTSVYWLLLAVIALGTYSWCATLYHVISEYDQLGKTINIAGKQRMLSQRLLILASRKQTEPDEIRAVVAKIKDNHEYLVDQIFQLERSKAAGPYVKAINRIFYEEPYQLVETISAFADTTTQIAGQAEYQQDSVNAQAEVMLQASDEVVNNFQRIYDVMFTTLRRVLLGSVLGASVILILSGVAVGHPLVRRIVEKFNLIKAQ